jgi:hypothetical protein
VIRKPNIPFINQLPGILGKPLCALGISKFVEEQILRQYSHSLLPAYFSHIFTGNTEIQYRYFEEMMKMA